MNEEENGRIEAFPGREKQARRTWFWTHLILGLVLVAVAIIVHQKAGRTVLALIFGVVGLMSLVDVFATPFRRGRKLRDSG